MAHDFLIARALIIPVENRCFTANLSRFTLFYYRISATVYETCRIFVPNTGRNYHVIKIRQTLPRSSPFGKENRIQPSDVDESNWLESDIN